MKEKIEITTATITIKVIQVDGQKMTLATFRQIEDTYVYYGFNREGVLGWVRDGDDIYVVWQYENTIKKCFIDPEINEDIHKDGVRIGSISLVDKVKEDYDQLFIAT
ncbi:MAG TPA: hypothetical protein ACFYEK_08985 [Candidatus Wunengus sp. YC60]|uniref:hypothetical protein n=1 Tax=Candidatus Wunengus sp. YC60 TaxID=3367697 RepID=UPI004027E420